MAFPFLIIAGLSVFWLGGQIQPLGDTFLTYVSYGLSAAFFVWAIAEGYLLFSDKEYD
tara:strand:+ start:325 stop:498 length:174 start_codon:yes stop_codon:yes gene_type:complete